jgi:hypothetical protein
MARNWDALAESTRTRYERAGVGRSAYEGGASLKAARGHSATPERPMEAERNPERYRSYVDIRNDIRELKKELYGDKYNDRHKERGGRAHLEKLRDILEAKIDFAGSWDEFWDEYPEYDRDDYADVEYYK